MLTSLLSCFRWFSLFSLPLDISYPFSFCLSGEQNREISRKSKDMQRRYFKSAHSRGEGGNQENELISLPLSPICLSAVGDSPGEICFLFLSFSLLPPGGIFLRVGMGEKEGCDITAQS